MDCLHVCFNFSYSIYKEKQSVKLLHHLLHLFSSGFILCHRLVGGASMFRYVLFCLFNNDCI